MFRKTNKIKFFNKILLFLFYIQAPFLKAEATEGYFLLPSFHYQTEEITTKIGSSSSTSAKERVALNLCAGYSLGSGLLLGLKYFQDTLSDSYLETFSARQDPDEIVVTAVGASIGFLVDRFSIVLSIMALDPPIMKNKNTKITYSGGTGTMLDLSYFAQMEGWYLGPQLIWRSFEYTKYKNSQDPNDGVAENFKKRTQVVLEPFISTLFFF